MGNSGLTVSCIGMGAMNLSFGTGKAVDVSAGVQVLRAAVEQGITFFDTAEAYGPWPGSAAPSGKADAPMST